MKPNKIILQIDEFTLKKISGWAAIRENDEINELPLIIVINDSSIIEVRDFIFREDLISAGLKTGRLAFSLDLELTKFDKVDIYTSKYNKAKVWSGIAGSFYNKASEIDYTNNSNFLSQVESREDCLFFYNGINFYSNNNNEVDSINAYELQTSIDGLPIFYFQLLMNGDVDFIADTDFYSVTRQQIGSVNQLNLFEYFIIVKTKAKGKRNSEKLRLRNSLINDSIVVKFIKPSVLKEFFYIASFEEKVLIRPNPKVRFLSDVMYPVIDFNISNFSGNTVSIIKNSVFCFQQEIITWSPVIVKLDILINKNKRNNFLNCIRGQFILFNTGGEPSFSLEHLIDYFERFGSLSFIDSLYNYLLGRTSDPNGLIATNNTFNSTIKERGLVFAVISIWNSFINSDEYKNKKIKYFPKKNWKEQ